MTLRSMALTKTVMDSLIMLKSKYGLEYGMMETETVILVARMITSVKYGPMYD